MPQYDIDRGDRMGRQRRQLWQCAEDLAWNPNAITGCRKCGQPRGIVGIIAELPVAVQNSATTHKTGRTEVSDAAIRAIGGEE